jgi:hypothetical protein
MKALATAAGLALFLALAGCGKSDSALPPEPPPPSEEEVRDRLARADALDGATDQVVGKCLTCNLSMDGLEKVTSTHGGYTLRFCARGCKDRFDRDPARAVGAVRFPEAK